MAVANLATQRSGETMDGTAAVAMTMLPSPRMATYLVDKLCMPWTSTSTTTAEATLQDTIIKKLSSDVIMILWTEAEREFEGVPNPITGDAWRLQEANQYTAIIPCRRLSFKQIDRLRKQQSLFQKQADELSKDVPITYLDASLPNWVPSLPLIFLAQRAARIQHAIHIASKMDELLSLSKSILQNESSLPPTFLDEF